MSVLIADISMSLDYLYSLAKVRWRVPMGLVQLVADCSCKFGERYSDTPGSKEVTGSIIRL